MVRVVVDTNILVSAMYSENNASREVVRRCLQGTLLPMMGNALFSEYEDVFSREAPFKNAAIMATERTEVLNAFFSVCTWVNISYLWRPNLRDEGDNHLIELAVAGNATTIVTANIRDLASGDLSFASIRMMTAPQFLDSQGGM